MGHLTRCVANIKSFRKISDRKIEIHTFGKSPDWLRSNLTNIKIKTTRNKKLQADMDRFLKSDLIVHDWREEVKKIKEARTGTGPIIAGIYHSDISFSDKDTMLTKKFKRQIRYISQRTTDIFFHINLKSPRGIPKLDTYYVPIPLIVRKPTMKPSRVKSLLGIPENEQFILVQMGGGIGKYRYAYMREWYEKVNKLQLPYRIVIANQLNGVDYQFRHGIIRAPLFSNGSDLVNAASLVISKPGMGILTDCISTGTPLLALPADSKEREVKNMMLRDLTGSSLCLASNQLSPEDLAHRVENVLSNASRIERAFQKIPRNGAEIVAKSLKLLSGRSLKDLPDIYSEILKLTPFNVK